MIVGLTNPIIIRLLEKRGILSEQADSFLNPCLTTLADPFVMKGMSKACERIHKASSTKETVLIHGDYDVDGITAAAILAKTFRVMGITPEVFLPDRHKDGYGVSLQAIKNASLKGIKLLVTADCGITAKSQMEEAKKLGMDVIIIDHHRIPSDGIPDAFAILNPLQEDCSYPFKDLSAGGLAYRFSAALIGPKANEFLDLAALSTVCDVAPLVKENRAIVKKGLEKIGEKNTVGMRALCEIAKLTSPKITAAHAGFVLGPRINAAGRMSSPEIAFRLLVSESSREAMSLASILEEENKTRQIEDRQVLKEAISDVEKNFHFNRDRIIVVARKDWHLGVIGIVASKLVEKFNRPAWVLTIQPDGTVKGSGRSVKPFHLVKGLEACSDLLVQFGGHELAAGLSMIPEKIDEFRKRLNAYAVETFQNGDFKKEIRFDCEIALNEIKTELLFEMMLLEPHGMGNPRPVFLTRQLSLKGQARPWGPQNMKFYVTDGNIILEAVCDSEKFSLTANKKFDLVYSLKTRLREGIESFHLDIKEILPHQ